MHPGNKFRDTQAPAQSQLGGSAGIPAVSLTQSLDKVRTVAWLLRRRSGRAGEGTGVEPPGRQVGHWERGGTKS